jgi:hypothetical protein
MKNTEIVQGIIDRMTDRFDTLQDTLKAFRQLLIVRGIIRIETLQTSLF